MSGSDKDQTFAPDGAVDQAGEAHGASGVRLVRSILLDALEGLPRPRKFAARDYDQLAHDLAYMSASGLHALAQMALRAGATRAGAAVAALDRPAPAVIRAWAAAIEKPPLHLDEYTLSVLRSRLGYEALAAGWHVVLMRHCRAGHKPPPAGDYVKRQLRDQAAEEARELERARARIGQGAPWADDAARVEAWVRAEAQARGMIEAGEAARIAALGRSGGQGSEGAAA